jgi:hypothetical protein
MAKRPLNPFLGHWRITEMEVWEQDVVDLKGPGYFQFDKDNLGSFQFGTTQGQLDCRLETVNAEARIEFSWNGQDYRELATGRGWAVVRNGELFGRLFIHLGDDSWFKAEKS